MIDKIVLKNYSFRKVMRPRVRLAAVYRINSSARILLKNFLKTISPSGWERGLQEVNRMRPRPLEET